MHFNTLCRLCSRPPRDRADRFTFLLCALFRLVFRCRPQVENVQSRRCASVKLFVIGFRSLFWATVLLCLWCVCVCALSSCRILYSSFRANAFNLGTISFNREFLAFERWQYPPPPPRSTQIGGGGCYSLFCVPTFLFGRHSSAGILSRTAFLMVAPFVLCVITSRELLSFQCGRLAPTTIRANCECAIVIRVGMTSSPAIQACRRVIVSSPKLNTPIFECKQRIMKRPSDKRTLAKGSGIVASAGPNADVMH